MASKKQLQILWLKREDSSLATVSFLVQPDVDPDQNFDSLLYSAQLFEQRGSVGSLEFTSHVDRLDSELGKR